MKTAIAYYDPRYYAVNVFDPDGYTLEAVYKSWQHRQSWNGARGKENPIHSMCATPPAACKSSRAESK